MYRLGEREHSHRKLYVTLGIFLILVVGGVIVTKQLLTSNTQITPAPTAVVTRVNYDQTKLQTISGPTFSMNIPASWKLSTSTADVPPKPTYLWQGTVGEDKNRWLSIYVDVPLPSFAVNRELHVQSSGASISVIGATSDNCTSFTGATSSTTGKSSAKWETIDFLCDSGNYERDVVGIVSPDGLNNVNLTGSKQGTHKYFFTYTDNSDQANYSIFSDALKTFKAK